MTKIDRLDKANAEVMADLIADSQTPDQLRVNIIEKLLEMREGQDFFKTVYEEGLSFGECPNCQHQNHWAIPEDVLNQMGWVTEHKDPRVKQGEVTDKDCPQFAQACKKKRVNV
jgi:hypothetical protein